MSADRDATEGPVGPRSVSEPDDGPPILDALDVADHPQAGLVPPGPHGEPDRGADDLAGDPLAAGGVQVHPAGRAEGDVTDGDSAVDRGALGSGDQRGARALAAPRGVTGGV